MKKYLKFKTTLGEYLLPLHRLSWVTYNNGGAAYTQLRFYREPTNTQYIEFTCLPSFDSEGEAATDYLNSIIKELCKTGNRNIVQEVGEFDNLGTIRFKTSTGAIQSFIISNIDRG